MRHQLEANEREDGREAKAKVHQPRQRALQHKVEGPQTKKRKGVGGEHQVRVRSDAVDGGDGVERKDDVRHHHGGNDQGQGRERLACALLHGELGPVVFASDGPELAQDAHNHDLVGVDLGVFVIEGIAQNLDRGHKQDHTKEEEGPVKAGEHLCTQPNEETAQRQRTHHSNEQHALLQHAGHGEGTQDQNEDKKVVHGQGFLHHVARVVLHTYVVAVLKPQPAAERHREGNVEDAPPHRLLERHQVRLVSDDKVHDHQRDHCAYGEPPHQRACDGMYSSELLSLGEKGHSSPQNVQL